MDSMDLTGTLQNITIVALPLIMAVCFHEAAHGFAANRLGDPTARMMGRLTLNPLRHIDLLGTVIIPLLLLLSQTGFIVGYAKPVPVNFYNFKNPKRDMIWVSASGPGTNFALALASGLLLRVILAVRPDLVSMSLTGGNLFSSNGLWASILVPVSLMLSFSVQINIILGFFNLIPIPPLDGGRIMVGILPQGPARLLAQIEPFGFVIVLLLLVFDPFGIMSHWVFGAMEALTRVFLRG